MGNFSYFCHVFGDRINAFAFAALVRYARNVATRLGHWYGLAGSNQKGEAMIKCIGGCNDDLLHQACYMARWGVTGGAALFGG